MDPIYIPSRGRYKTISTHKHFDRCGMKEWYYVVEKFDYINYVHALEEQGIEDASFHVIPFDTSIFKEPYDAETNPLGFQYLDDLGWKPGLTTGPGPARNAIHQIAKERGLEHYYMMDDDIVGFQIDAFHCRKGVYTQARKNKNEDERLNIVKVFELFERLLDKYDNIGHAEFEKSGMAMNHRQNKHFSKNCKTYSCIRIRTDLDIPWRSRWNDDVVFSLDAEKRGYVNVSSKIIAYATPDSQQQAGGMTEAFKEVGTIDKVSYLVKAHPDVSKLTLLYGRLHHQVSYGRFKQPLVLKDDVSLDDLVYDLDDLGIEQI